MPLNKASVSKSYTSQSIRKVNNNFAVLKIREGLIRFFLFQGPIVGNGILCNLIFSMDYLDGQFKDCWWS